MREQFKKIKKYVKSCCIENIINSCGINGMEFMAERITNKEFQKYKCIYVEEIERRWKRRIIQTHNAAIDEVILVVEKMRKGKGINITDTLHRNIGYNQAIDDIIKNLTALKKGGK